MTGKKTWVHHYEPWSGNIHLPLFPQEIQPAALLGYEGTYSDSVPGTW